MRGDEPEEVKGCVTLFANMFTDYTTVLSRVAVAAMMQRSNITVEAFYSNTNALRYEAFVTPIDISTVEGFLLYLVACYCDALRFIREERLQEAITLAQSFASIIYER